MGNQERNSYVKNQIIQATVKAFEEGDWEKLTISGIIAQAQVSRNSFYRNFDSKEQILQLYVEELSKDWIGILGDLGNQADSIRILFQHLEEHKDFYGKLYSSHKLYLVKDVLVASLELLPDSPAIEAYSKAFVTYSLYGWIETWFQRGMKETADEIAGLFGNSVAK